MFSPNLCKSYCPWFFMCSHTWKSHAQTLDLCPQVASLPYFSKHSTCKFLFFRCSCCHSFHAWTTICSHILCYYFLNICVFDFFSFLNFFWFSSLFPFALFSRSFWCFFSSSILIFNFLYLCSCFVVGFFSIFCGSYCWSFQLFILMVFLRSIFVFIALFTCLCCTFLCLHSMSSASMLLFLLLFL